MKTVTIVRSPLCIFCRRAEHLLKTKQIPFETIDVLLDPKTREIHRKKTGHPTIPIIYIGDDFIGGYDELYRLDKTGQLDAILKAT